MHDVVFGDDDLALFALLAPFGEDALELLLRLLLVVAQGGGFFEVLRLDRRLLAAADLFDLLLDVLDVRRPGHRADARARAGFVHDVDGLVRQEAAGEIAVAELDAPFERLIGVARLVVRLVLRRRPLRIRMACSTLGASTFTCWKRRSSAASFSMYLRYSLSVVAPTHCSSPRLSAGLMMLRRVHRAFGGTGADDGVQLVDEQDDVLGAADFVHHRLDALLELAAVLRAGDHQREVERDDFLVAEQLRHVAGGDFLGEAFDDRGLADAGFADEHRIVLRAAAEHLNDALDFALAADHRIDLALLRELREVAAKGAQRGRLDVLLPAARAASCGGLPVRPPAG